MSEERNDSPAFRLRPRHAAPKSYYTVRLEYSANPAAFIRERPRGISKRKVFTQKSGSNSTKSASSKNLRDTNLLLNVASKEEKEREARRVLLRRDIRESITTNTKMSPFMQRLDLSDLEPDSVYEHNYITLRIKAIKEQNDSQILYCLCQGTDKSSSEQYVTVCLHNEYAETRLIKLEKVISIGKFRTAPVKQTSESSDDSDVEITYSNIGSGSSSSNGSRQHAQSDNNSETRTSPNGIKSDGLKTTSPTSSEAALKLPILPFHVIVKYDELVERLTPSASATRGSPSTSSPMKTSLSRRLLIPFVSITDMIEQPIEPFVELSPDLVAANAGADTESDHNYKLERVKTEHNDYVRPK